MLDSDNLSLDAFTVAAAAGTKNGTTLDLGPTMSPSGETWQLNLKAFAGTTPTMTAKIQESANDSTWIDLATFSPAIAAAGNFNQFVTVKSSLRYRRVTYTTTAGAGDLAGTITVGPVPAGEYTNY